MPADVDAISGRSKNVGAKMFASAHLSSAVAGINSNGRHREPISLLPSFCHNALFAWLPL